MCTCIASTTHLAVLTLEWCTCACVCYSTCMYVWKDKGLCTFCPPLQHAHILIWCIIFESHVSRVTGNCSTSFTNSCATSSFFSPSMTGKVAGREYWHLHAAWCYSVWPRSCILQKILHTFATWLHTCIPVQTGCCNPLWGSRIAVKGLWAAIKVNRWPYRY